MTALLASSSALSNPFRLVDEDLPAQGVPSEPGPEAAALANQGRSLPSDPVSDAKAAFRERMRRAPVLTTGRPPPGLADRADQNAWVVWYPEPREGRPGKLDKKPLGVPDGKAKGWNGPGRQGTFAQALTLARSARPGRELGIGYLPKRHRGQTIFDLDGCVDVDGKVSPEARELIAEAGSYAELSPSGTGVRIVTDGVLPEDAGGAKGTLANGLAVELFCDSGFVTMTGDQLPGTPAGRADCQALIDRVHGEIKRSDDREQAGAAVANGHADNHPAGDGPGLRPPDHGASEAASANDVLSAGVKRHWWNAYSPEEKDRHLDAMLEAEPPEIWKGKREPWLDLMASAARSGAPSAKEIFRRHSLKDRSNYPGDREFDRQFDSFAKEPAREGGITIGTVVKRYQERGCRLPEPKARAGRNADQETSYVCDEGGTYRVVRGDNPRERRRLANFAARITADVVRDDGAETARRLEIEARLGDRTVRTAIAADRFADMDWVVPQLGPDFVIEPGPGNKDHMRAAIQKGSPDLERRTVFAHTGWREVAGRDAYLHAGGAIGAHGTISGIQVELPDGLVPMRLPDPPDGPELTHAVEASLRLLEVGDLALTMPLLAATVRAPLGPVPESLFLVGPTGRFKTELAALAQRHFGRAFGPKRLPANFQATANGNEPVLFAAKDALVVVDDYAPGANQREEERARVAAERIIRGQGNGAARRRLRQDGSARPARPPRATLLLTGEQLPPGQSLGARLIGVEVSAGAVDGTRLTAAQADAGAGHYAAAMAGYVRWIATDRRGKLAILNGLRLPLEQRFAALGLHARTGRGVADLTAGLLLYLRFAEKVGALDAAGRSRLEGECARAMVRLLRAQAGPQREQEPGRRFVELIASLLRTGRCHLEDLANPGHPPVDPYSLGWRRDPVPPPGQPLLWWPQGKGIGWAGPGVWYLDPNAAYAEACRLAKEQGEGLGVTQQWLWKRLREDGLLAKHDHDRSTVREQIDGRRVRVLALKAP